MTGHEWDLPRSLNVGGVVYPIRTDFRVVLDILRAFNDPDLDDVGKNCVMLRLIFPGWRDIPKGHLEEAMRAAADFIDAGNKPNGKNHPKMIDWEQDAPLIIPAVNAVAHAEIREMQDLHWWTFLGWFMEIRESTFSSILYIRDKRIKGKKLEKWEKEFIRDNRHLVDFRKRKMETEEDIAEKAYYAKWGLG